MNALLEDNTWVEKIKDTGEPVRKVSNFAGEAQGMRSKDAYLVQRCRRTERVSSFLLTRFSWMRLTLTTSGRSDPPVVHDGQGMWKDSCWADPVIPLQRWPIVDAARAGVIVGP